MVSVETALYDVEGVETVEMTIQGALVEYDHDLVETASLEAAVEGAGFTVTCVEDGGDGAP